MPTSRRRPVFASGSAGVTASIRSPRLLIRISVMEHCFSIITHVTSGARRSSLSRSAPGPADGAHIRRLDELVNDSFGIAGRQPLYQQANRKTTRRRYLRHVQIKVEYSQPHELATAFGVRWLDTALVIRFDSRAMIETKPTRVFCTWNF